MLATLRHRDFALLWFAGLVSVAGDFALFTALPLHAYALTGSAAAAGGVFAATLLPRLLLGSIAGVYVDRWDRQRTMVAADVLRALVLLPLLAVVSADLLWLLYLVKLATGVLGLFFDPAESALLPKLVGADRLVTANALNALNNNLGRLVGPALGGVLYAAGGLGTVVLVDAASFALSAGLIAAIRASVRPEGADQTATDVSAGRRLLGEWRAGFQAIGQNRAISAIFLSLGIGLMGEGIFEVGFAPLVLDVFAGGPSGAGVLLSGQAVGGILAGAFVARIAQKVAPRTLYAAGLLGIGLADLGVANAASFALPGPPAVALATAFMAVAGIPAVASLAAANGILQIETTDAYRGRVFGALGALQGLSALVGLALGSVAIPEFGVVPVFNVGALLWVAGGIAAFLWLPHGAGVSDTVVSEAATV